MSIFGLDYVLWNLKAGGDGLKTEDDMCNSELTVTVEEDLESQESQDLVEVGKIH